MIRNRAFYLSFQVDALGNLFILHRPVIGHFYCNILPDIKFILPIAEILKGLSGWYPENRIYFIRFSLEEE
jgi:hypothetical protein